LELTVAALVLVSAALHPIWNAIAKGDDHPEWIFFSLLCLTTTFAGSHALLIGEDVTSIARAWPFPLISSGGLLLYGITLVLTLRRGDLSIYYPIVRASPLFIVLVGFFLLGERYGAALLGGIALVLVGAFFLQYRRGARLFAEPLTLTLAVLAMVGTGIYSIADWHGVQRVAPMLMFFWATLITVPFYAGFLWFLHRDRDDRAWQRFLIGWQTRPLRHLAVGVLAYASYFMLLSAYHMGGNVAAVTSVRQASIPISVLIGGIFLKEAGMAARIAWSLVLSVGIVVIIVAR
jgi:drug/metabolite transporter (DMT)-like permease